LREFLGRNGYPYTYVDLDSDKTSQELLDRFAVKLEDVPIVICHTGGALRNPTVQQLAECIGLNAGIDSTTVRDVIIVAPGRWIGSGVYAASEGLNSLLIEAEAPGGQADPVPK